jgi:hypothetical protein
MEINYALIGSIPEVEVFRNSLPKLIEEYEARISPRLQQMALGVTIEMCAQHFYGIDVAECGSMKEVIDAIRSMDEELEFK